MEFYAYHGHFEEEQKIGTWFSLDLTMDVDTSKAELSDELDDTVDYSAVYQVVKEKMMIPSKLLEHVGRRILNTIKETYSNERVTDIDGVKIDFDTQKCWVHLRKSNTEPIIRIYAEGPTQAEADALAQSIISQINTIIG